MIHEWDFQLPSQGGLSLLKQRLYLHACKMESLPTLRDMTRHGAGFGLEIVKITNSIIVNKHLKLSAY
jgi:hypothetical protein